MVKSRCEYFGLILTMPQVARHVNSAILLESLKGCDVVPDMKKRKIESWKASSMMGLSLIKDN